MKYKKWLWMTLTTLLTLIVLIGVAGAGYRMGIMQNTNLIRSADGTTSQFSPFSHMRGFEKNFNNQPGADSRIMLNFSRGDPRQGGFEHGHSGHGFPPIYGLIHLIVLGLLLWGGYKLYKMGSWQFVKINTPAAEPIEVKYVAKKKK